MKSRRTGGVKEAKVAKANNRIFSIGHSNRTRRTFIQLLLDAGIRRLIDVRSRPYSPRNPHFNKKALERDLADHGIEYSWMGELLGGFQEPDYPTYTTTEAFAQGIEDLIPIAGGTKTAIMCAERRIQDCHRQHITAALQAQGWSVVLLGESPTLDV